VSRTTSHFSDVVHTVTGTLYGRLISVYLQQIVTYSPAWVIS
jgi:hypothetical protein